MNGGQVAIAHRLLHEEHKYEGGLPRKAVHKLLYLLNTEARREGLEIDLPYFWFQYGIVTPVEANTVQEQSSPQEPGYEGQWTELETELRPLARRVLRHYYSTSLEEVTDETYEDAPHDVQRAWRVLDKKLRTLHPEYSDFFEVEPSRDSIEESIFDVYDTFPTAQFPDFESDLTKWYSMMTRELNRPEIEPIPLMEVNVLFWRIFSLRLAEDHRHGLSKHEVRDILGIDSFEAARESCRSDLERIQSAALRKKFDDDSELDTVETRAADALTEGVVSNHIQTYSD